MRGSDLFIFEEEYKQLSAIISKLRSDSRARLVFLIDKNGQQIAADGDLQNIDTTSLASLSASNVAATDGLAKILGDREFNILFHEGEKDNIHISIVGGKIILVVIFDQRSSLGLVRLRVKKANHELERVFKAIEQKIQHEKEVVKKEFESPFTEISDEDIDKLFG